MEEKPEINPQEEVTKKDPKRVEQGKRLAAISKQAKEDKMRKKIYEEDFSYFPYIIYGIAGVSTFGLMYLLLFGKNDKKDFKWEPVKVVKNSPKKEIPKKFENFS